MGLAVHAVAGIAILFAAVIAVRVGIHLGGAFSDSLIGLVALEAGFLRGGLELAVGVVQSREGCGPLIVTAAA